MAPPEARMFAEMSPEQFVRPDRFGFMAQGALIAEYLTQEKGTQEEWVERYAAVFRSMLPQREQDWRAMTSERETRDAGLRAIQEELDAATRH